MPDNTLPVGAVVPYLGLDETLPRLVETGWLVCDGSAQSVTAYPALYEALGPGYGKAEAGSFRLPDLRGMFLRGIDPDGAVDPDHGTRSSRDPHDPSVEGAVVGSRQGHALERHRHHWDHNFGHIGDGGSDIDVQLTADSPTGPDIASGPTTNVDGGGDETRPVNVYVHYLVRAW